MRGSKARAAATLVLAVLGAVGAAVPGTASAAELYASPTGAGTACTAAQPCSLEGARDQARLLATPTMTADVEVLLLGGTYRLANTFTLGPTDSGENGHRVVYRAATPDQSPVLSGGRPVTGWADAGGGVWTAPVPPGTMSRQLYVNGVRAQRAKGVAAVLGFPVKPTADDTGYTSTSTAILGWAHPEDVEFLYRGAPPWGESRCGVASVAPDPEGTKITMDQPCFAGLQRVYPGTAFPVARPTSLENALEVLDQPGEWYLDSAAGTLHYRPRPGESMASADVILPTLERLMRGTGTVGNPIHDMRFEGLTFTHSTWLVPSTGTGFPESQANLYFPGAAGAPAWAPGDVAFTAAQDLVFDRNTFVHLGWQGLSFDGSSQDNTVSRSTFSDISGLGIRLGGIGSTALDSRNTVSDNTVHDVALEYAGGVGIGAGRVIETTIEHNEVADLPYTGISVGFGAGSGPYGGNVIAGNEISRVMGGLTDGGSIYVNGHQPASRISGNWIHDDESDPAASSSAIYLDNGSDFWEVDGNVASDTGTSRWLNVQSRVAPFATNNSIHDNFSDTTYMVPDYQCVVLHDPCPPFPPPQPPPLPYPDGPLNGGDPSNTVEDNTFVLDGNWPSGAVAIVNAAGVRPAPSPPPAVQTQAPTGERAAALKKCRKKHSKKKRKNCKRKARKLPL